MGCGVHTDMSHYQYGNRLNKGLILMPAQPTPELLLMRGNESRSLAKHVKHHKHLQYSHLKDGCGRRKTLPSAMNSCLGLEPGHVLHTLTLKCPNPCWQPSLQASGNQWKKMQIFLDNISGRDCVSRKAPFSSAGAWYPLPSSYATLAFFSVWSIGAANNTDLFQLTSTVKVDGAPKRECLSIPPHHDLENGSYIHLWGKKTLCWKKKKTWKIRCLLYKPQTFFTDSKIPSSWFYQNGALSITP